MKDVLSRLPEDYAARWQALADAHTGGNRTAMLRAMIDAWAPPGEAQPPVRMGRPRRGVSRADVAAELRALLASCENGTWHPMYEAAPEWERTGRWPAMLVHDVNLKRLRDYGIPEDLLKRAGLA